MLTVSRDGARIVAERDGAMVADEPAGSRSDLLLTLQPSEEEDERLRERWEDNEGNDNWDDEWTRPPLTADVIVDGQAWGWSWWGDRWHLLPAGKGDEVARLGGGFEASMTGVVISGIICRRTGCAIAGVKDDIDGLRYEEVKYATESWSEEEWDNLLERCADGLGFDEWICPCCEDDEGWVLDIDASIPPFTEVGLARAIGRVWRPCKDHDARDATLKDVSGRDWVWRGGAWIPTAPSGPQS